MPGQAMRNMQEASQAMEHQSTKPTEHQASKPTKHQASSKPTEQGASKPTEQGASKSVVFLGLLQLACILLTFGQSWQVPALLTYTSFATFLTSGLLTVLSGLHGHVYLAAASVASSVVAAAVATLQAHLSPGLTCLNPLAMVAVFLATILATMAPLLCGSFAAGEGRRGSMATLAAELRRRSSAVHICLPPHCCFNRGAHSLPKGPGARASLGHLSVWFGEHQIVVCGSKGLTQNISFQYIVAMF